MLQTDYDQIDGHDQPLSDKERWAIGRDKDYERWVVRHDRKSKEHKRKALRGRFHWGRGVRRDLNDSDWGDSYIETLADQMDRSHEWIYQHIRFVDALEREFGDDDPFAHYLDECEKRDRRYSWEAAKRWMSAVSDSEDGPDGTDTVSIQARKVTRLATTLDREVEELATLYVEHHEELEQEQREEIEQILIRVQSTIESIRDSS